MLGLTGLSSPQLPEEVIFRNTGLLGIPKVLDGCTPGLADFNPGLFDLSPGLEGKSPGLDDFNTGLSDFRSWLDICDMVGLFAGGVAGGVAGFGCGLPIGFVSSTACMSIALTGRLLILNPQTFRFLSKEKHQIRAVTCLCLVRSNLWV